MRSTKNSNDTCKSSNLNRSLSNDREAAKIRKIGFCKPEKDQQFEFLKLSKIRQGFNSQLKIVEKNKRELTIIYNDKWPLLRLRLWLMDLFARVQHFSYLVVTTKLFESLSLIAIVLNTGFMIVSDPNDGNSILNKSEFAFFVIYSVELGLKMLGMGLFTKKIGFFRNGWNVLDFFIVFGSLVNILLKDLNLNLSALRSLRVLRPLKTVSSVKSLKNIILTIFSSLPFLKDIYIILFFLFFLFGVAGLHLFNGIFKQQCYDPVTGQVAINNPISLTGYCDMDSSCPGNSICIGYYETPFYGQTSFDNVIMGALMSFQVSTTENWSWMMYSLEAAFTSVMSAVTYIYFVGMIIVLNLVVGNLMLAVIVVKFNETHEKISKELTEQVHSEFCNCHTGFNYAQMKVCGYFLSLSNLKGGQTSGHWAKRYTYDFRKEMKPPRRLELDPDFRFVVVETLKQTPHQKQKQVQNDPVFMHGIGKIGGRLSRRISRVKPEQKAKESWVSKRRKSSGLPLLDVFLKRKTRSVMPVEQFESRESEVLQKTSFRATDTLEDNPLIDHTIAIQEEVELEAEHPDSLASESNIAEEGLQQADEPLDSIPSSASCSLDDRQLNNNNFASKKIDLRVTLKESILPKPIFANSTKRVTFDATVSQKISPELLVNESLQEFDETFKNAVKSSNEAKEVFGSEIQPYFFHHRGMNRRRNARGNVTKPGARVSGRQSIYAIVTKNNETPHSNEQIELKKEQIKAEKEFKQFTNSALSLLKLDLDYCKRTFTHAYEDMESHILPSKRRLKEQEDQRKKYEAWERSRIQMVYQVKYLNAQNKKKRKSNRSANYDSEGDYSESNMSQSNPNSSLGTIQISGQQSLQTMSLTREHSITRQPRPKLRVYEDIKRAADFYFYMYSCSYLVHDSHEQVKSALPSQPVVNSDRDLSKRPKQSVCKAKSKNFSTIHAFFAEEFGPAATSGPINFDVSLNERLLIGLLNDSLEKHKIIHTNWSGVDVQASNSLRVNKAILVFNKLNIQVEEVWLPGLLGKFNMFRRMIRQVFNMPAVDFFFIGLVLLNTVILALNGLVNDTDALDTLNLILTIIFTLEICFKFVGLGPIKFSKDVFNIFDSVVITLSVSEILIGSNSRVLSAIKVIRVLRTVRVLRVSRILRQLKFIRTLIRIFQITLEQFVFITLLLLLFLTIFSLIGMQLYAGKWTFLEPGEIMAQNFETFYDAFLVMLDVMSIVNWNDTLVFLARTDVNYAISCLYLIVWIFIGNYILLNLFTAVLLDGFSSAVTINRLEDLNNEFEGIEQAVKAEVEKRPVKDTSGRLELDFPQATADLSAGIDNQKEAIKNTIIYNFDQRVNNEVDENEEQEDPKTALIERLKFEDQEASVSSIEQDLSRYVFKTSRSDNAEQELLDSVACRESLFLFPKDRFPRIYLIKLVSAPMFENFILFTIFVSSMHLVITTYSDASWTGTTLQAALDTIDLIVNAIFFFECLTKVIAYGFFWCKGSYLRDNWSVLDFIIVCTSALDLALRNSNIQFLGVVKIVRTLRPLRVLSHNPNLKIVIQCLFQSFTGIVNVAVVVLMIWLMYGILGVNLIGNKLSYCSFPDNRNYFYVNVTMCPELGGTWSTWGFNYDNIFSAMSTIFVFSNAENWNTYNYLMMNGDDPSVGPSLKASMSISYFNLVIIFTSTFFLTKLFIGVIYSEFASEQEKLSKQNFRVISDDQIKWIQMQKMIKSAQPNYVEVVVPENRIRLFIYRMVTSSWFEWAILIMILMNMVVLAMVYETMNPLYGSILNSTGFVFTTAFTLEAVLKLTAYGPSAYFSSNWNRFDFLIVVVSLLDIVLTNFVNIQGISIYPLIGRIMRILRVTRLFKIMKSKSLEGINKIIKTLFYSIPAILNVIMVLFLVYFIYAVLGVFLFKSFDPCFADFLTSLIFLFKSSTGESWPDYMYADEVGSMIPAVIFWHSFMFLTTFTLMNLFMSVIIDQFQNFYFNADNPINSFEEIVDEFRVCWLLFTSKQRGERIKARDLLNFFICLKSPLGFHIPLRKESPDVYGSEFSVKYFQSSLKFELSYVRRKVSEMRLIEDRNGYISFGQVLHAALKNAFGKNCYKNTDSDTYREIKRIELKTIGKIFNRKIDDYEIETGQNGKKIKARIANPFTNVLFSQMVFQIWYAHARAELKESEPSSEDLEDVLNKNPERQFVRYVLKSASKLASKNQRSDDGLLSVASDLKQLRSRNISFKQQ